jgi:hypothetical protein
MEFQEIRGGANAVSPVDAALLQRRCPCRPPQQSFPPGALHLRSYASPLDELLRCTRGSWPCSPSIYLRGREPQRERLLQRYGGLECKSDPVTAAIPVMRLIEKPPRLEQVPCYSGKRVPLCLSCRISSRQRRRTVDHRDCGRVLCIALGARECLTPRCYLPPRQR